MAITYVGGASAIASGSTTVGITIPLNSGLTGGSNTAISTGDLVIVSLAHGAVVDTAMSLVTSGYTQLTQLYANDTYDTNLAVFYKFVTSGTDTSVVSTNPGNAAYAQAMTVHVFRGAKANTAPTISPSSGIDSGRPVIPNISTPANSVVMHVGAYANATSTITLGSTGLTDVRSVASPDTTAVSLLSGYIVQATAGTVTGQTLTNAGNNTSQSWASAALSIQQQPPNNSLTSTDITTGSPTLDTTTLEEVFSGNYDLAATDITTAAPTLDTSTLVATSILEATGITTEAVSIAVATLSQTHTLSSTTIDTGVPTLDTAILVAIAGLNELTANSIVTGVPELEASTIGQEHTLTATNITTEAVTVGNTTLQVTSVLVAVNVDTEAPTLGTPSASAFATLVSDGITTASASVATTEIGQLHVLLSVSITTAPPVVSSTVAYSQAAFSEDYERKRTVWVLSENRVVVVSKDDTPTVVTAERENRITTI